MKSPIRLIKPLNACTSLLLHIQPNCDSPMLAEDDNASDYFMHHKEEEYLLGNKGQDVEEDQRDWVGKSSNNESIKHMLPGCTSQDGLFRSKSSSSLKEVRFSKQECPTGTLISNIKYDHSRSQNNNPFHPFNDQFNYVLAHYFTESKITKGNVDRLLFNTLMAPLTEKLFYGNPDEWMEKLSEIP